MGREGAAIRRQERIQRRHRAIMEVGRGQPDPHELRHLVANRAAPPRRAHHHHSIVVPRSGIIQEFAARRPYRLDALRVVSRQEIAERDDRARRFTRFEVAVVAPGLPKHAPTGGDTLLVDRRRRGRKHPSQIGAHRVEIVSIDTEPHPG